MRGSRFSSHHAEIGMEGTEGELNLVPYLDIMINLVMFLLFSFQIVHELSMIDVNAPSYGNKPAAGSDEQKKVVTKLLVAKTGYKILFSDATLPTVDVPKLDTKLYDTKGLTEQLARVKAEFGLGTEMVVTAEADISYANIVDALDASRENDGKELFPDVVLAVAAGVK